MSGNEIRTKFLNFFEKRGHTIIPSASLVPENDPSVLFNTAGMQPLVPYLLGQEHPTGSKRIVNSQKCIRTNDIEEVGDNTHLTFFEMLGNWSLGDYFKEDALKWSFEFLTDQEEGLGLDPKRIYVTVFAGDENAPKDAEAYAIWEKIFSDIGLDPEQRIFFLGADSNWWSPGDNGPCGPDSEMFYDVSGELTEGLTKEQFLAADDRQDVIEIWNDVFMEYEKKDGVIVGKLANKNVDTGSGLERVTGVVQGKDNVFETDLFLPIIHKIEELSNKQYTLAQDSSKTNSTNANWREDNKAMRIIADHIRASVFLIADGVSVSNTDQGYILRRLLRRSIRQGDKLGLAKHSLKAIAQSVIDIYGEMYTNLKTQEDNILNLIDGEETQFRTTLEHGLKQFEKIASDREVINNKMVKAEDLFLLFTTYGFPIELTKEIASERNLLVDEAGFRELMLEHREKSRSGAAQKFKGGLADHSEKVVEYHTATHLLLAALQHFLGKEVHQAGSNITSERLRFDFTHPQKVERETLDKIEDWVNEKISTGGEVTIETMPKATAEQDSTIEGSFWDKYPDMVNVYTIHSRTGDVISRELCGGPHVSSLTKITPTFVIKKEESVAAGVRRIKAVLE